MKILLILFLNLLASVLVFADEPLDWKAFLIYSDNKQWTAVVEPLGQDAFPQKDKWRVSVFNQHLLSFPSPDQAAVWSAAFLPTGYPGGLLSDDGKVFVHIEFWYSPDKPMVTIYRENCRFEKLGSSFKFSINLPNTESHQLWLQTTKTNRLFKQANQWLLEVFTIERNYLISTECNNVKEKTMKLILDSASESVLNKSNLDRIKRFIIQQGKTCLYSNMYNNNPCFQNQHFSAFLIPDPGPDGHPQWNAECDITKGDFNRLVIRTKEFTYRDIDFRSYDKIFISLRSGKENITEDKLKETMEQAAREILDVMGAVRE